MKPNMPAIDDNYHPNTPLLTEEELGHHLKLSTQCVRNWRKRGEGPPHLLLAKKAIRYRLSDVDVWINQRNISNTIDQGQGGVQ